MTTPSIDLLKSLESKLKTANIRSPYLRATIGRSRNRIDLKSLELLNDDRDNIQTFWGQIVNAEQHGSVDLTLRISSKSAAEKKAEERFKKDVLITRLKNIHFDQEEDFLEHGTRSFGFGYPMLAIRSKQDKKRTILAPLFIWSLDIAPLPNNHNAYRISRNEDHPIQLNPQLSAFLAQDRGIALEQIPEEYFDDSCLSEAEITTLTAQFCEILGAKEVNPEEGFVGIQELDYYEKMAEQQPLIFRAGIFSLFKSNRESIAADYEKMIRGDDDLLFDTPDIYRPYQQDYFSAVQLDPSQESILRNINEHQRVIIQGPPGTGKSNSLTGIILNALENNATVLVVCEKRTASEVIYENLRDKGLEEFCIILDNVSTDRQRIVKALRDRFDNRPYENASSENYSEYQNSKSQFDGFYERVQKHYGNVIHKVMGSLTWKACIGNYLKARREVAGQVMIQPKDRPDGLPEDLFFSTLNAVKEAAFLRDQIGEEKQIFDRLTKAMFIENMTTLHLQNIEKQWSEHKQTSGELATQWKSWLSKYNVVILQSLLTPNFFGKVKAFLSKNTKAEQLEFQKLYKDSLSYFREAPHLLIFDTPLEADLFNIAKSLESLHNTFNECLAQSTLFRSYYQFRHFYWLCENEFSRAMIDALDNIDIKQWESKYRLWFFNELLLEKEVELGDFPIDDAGLDNIRSIDQKIDQQQGSAIRDIWYFHQREIMKSRTLQSVRLTFNLRANNTFRKRNSLRYLMHDEFDLITSFFPVIMVNPSVCSSIFPLKRGLFDLVIFDEASQLRLEDTYPALLRGRFQIISGDVHQMPPSSHFSNQNATATGAIDELEDDVVYSEEESLLTFAQNADYEFNYLDFHYRSQHPHLIDFSNAAFYGKRLVPMPPSSDLQPIMMREVVSVYQENTNAGEADEILKIIFEEIQPDKKGNYPSIGVATLNMTQQRYLWERIWSLADQDEAIRSKLAQLEAAGFFIKNLENIQGDQRDIIIISTTFGVRPDGRFIQNFGPLNQEKGYKLLNVIVTRAKQQIYLVTSIPSEFYSNYRDDIMTTGKTGKGIFYAYLNYAKFCSEGNENAREELLNFLMQDQQQEAKPTPSAANFLTESPFEEEVVNALLAMIPSEFIKTQFQMGGFRLDIVIKNKAGLPVIVIECDGKAYHSSKVAYRYDIHRQNILERHGLHVYRIWSTNWWRERDREILKMKRMLEERCGEIFNS